VMVMSWQSGVVGVLVTIAVGHSPEEGNAACGAKKHSRNRNVHQTECMNGFY
jgi:hypothetical protein